MPDLTADLFGSSAIPGIPGRAAALFEHQVLVARPPFSKGRVESSAARRLVEPTAASVSRFLKIARQFQQWAVANRREAPNS